MKTTMKIVMMALVALLALTTVSFGAVLPNATPETQGIETTTYIECTGQVWNTDSFTSELSNQALDGAPLAKGEVYDATSYTSRVAAIKGVTVLDKQVSLNNKNQILTGENIDVTQTLDFNGYDGGQVTGAEEAATFNTGMATDGSKTFMCVFGNTAGINPPFNEMVVMGNKYSATEIGLETETGVTAVAKTADVPASIHMDVGATGEGKISTYMSVFAQDARGTGQTLVSKEIKTVIPAVKDECDKVITPEKTVITPAVYTPITPSSEIRYSEKTTAMGSFVFGKSMKYTSQIG